MNGTETIFLMSAIVFFLGFLYKLYNVLMFNQQRKVKQKENEGIQNQPQPSMMQGSMYIPTLQMSFIIFVVMIITFGVMFMATMIIRETIYIQIFQLMKPLFILSFLFQFFEILIYGWTKLPFFNRYSRG